MITVLENKNNILKFNCKNSNELTVQLHHVLLNSIRRIIISEIPTYAIEIVDILKNNSILVDLILAHRLGLLPIKVLVDDSEENRIKLENLKITLRVSYNKNKADIFGIHTIYASDLEYDRNLIEIDKNIIIIKLLKNQEIDLDARLKLGTAQEHAKWSPVCVASSFENVDHSYTFTIETIGTQKPIDIFVKAIDILKNKVDLLNDYC